MEDGRPRSQIGVRDTKDNSHLARCPFDTTTRIEQRASVNIIRAQIQLNNLLVALMSKKLPLRNYCERIHV